MYVHDWSSTTMNTHARTHASTQARTQVSRRVNFPRLKARENFGYPSIAGYICIKTMSSSSYPPVFCRRAHVYMPYLCLVSNSGVQHISCCVFVLLVFILCILCCRFLWIVHFCLHFQYYITFIYIYVIFILFSKMILFLTTWPYMYCNLFMIIDKQHNNATWTLQRLKCYTESCWFYLFGTYTHILSY